ncbi:hypothetical protein A3K64_03125 [Candidatus Micrarchaeota archaeon RBG_16_36_9]|nr:MAG: hypothetical protein A3K64_03125 [Candidatus Micrarchaeota archaeon RBG_16_36_9]
MKTETFFDYDPENDSLFIYKKSKIKGSFDIGDIIVDMSIDGKIKGIELLNANDSLRNLGIRNPKEVLNNIKTVRIRAVYKSDSITVYYSIVSKAREVSSSIAVPIQVK